MKVSKQELAVLRYFCRYPHSTAQAAADALGIDPAEMVQSEYALLAQDVIRVSAVDQSLRYYEATETGHRIARIAL
ncbi:MAG: hypothetical protein AAF223_00155 [Bacteroidota bacterium]